MLLVTVWSQHRTRPPRKHTTHKATAEGKARTLAYRAARQAKRNGTH